MKIHAVIFALVAGIAIASCGGKGSNRKIMEAGEIHVSMMMKYDSVYHRLNDEKQRVSDALGTMDVSDKRRPAYESMLRSIDRGLSLIGGWESAVVGVPGVQTDIHHHHSSDHEHHHHDNDAILDNMTDQEILDLQKAYNTKLNEVVKEINTLLETIQQYDAYSPK